MPASPRCPTCIMKFVGRSALTNSATSPAPLAAVDGALTNASPPRPPMTVKTMSRALAGGVKTLPRPTAKEGVVQMQVCVSPELVQVLAVGHSVAQSASTRATTSKSVARRERNAIVDAFLVGVRFSSRERERGLEVRQGVVCFVTIEK